MKLIFPDISYKTQVKEFIQEFTDAASEIHGVNKLNHYLQNSDYEAWLQKLQTDMDIANLPEEEIPRLTYFYVREQDNKIIGMITLRLSANDNGHIGYCIRPSERGKQYSVKMLYESLKVYHKLGISHVLITCKKSNKISAATIKRCGGQLISEKYSEIYKEDIQTYVIRGEWKKIE